MAIVVNCPNCGRNLRVPDDLLGKDVKCPACESVFTAAATSSSPGEAAAVPERPAAVQERPAPDYDEPYPEEQDRPARRGRPAALQPHRGTMILVFGILSLVICGLLGPFAWVMGNNDLRDMRAGRMDPEGEGITNAGRICGMIGSILGILQLVCCLGYFVVVVALGVGGAAGGRVK